MKNFLFLVLLGFSLARAGAAGADLPSFISAGQTVQLPAGTYPIGKLRLAHDVTLEGAPGGGTILVAEKAATLGPVIILNSHCTLRNLAVAGGQAERIGISARNVEEVTVENVSVDGVKQSALEFDHVNHFQIRGCNMAHAERGIHLIFSSHGVIAGNTVEDCTEHGIQFWGNWEWQKQEVEDLAFDHNQVNRSGLGAIWGTGGTNIHMRDNQIDGALDVGLDLEWCRNSTIENNTVHRVGNAAIALFFCCDHIQIMGNTLYNDAPEALYTDGRPTHRYAIWLTSPDKSQCPIDEGHHDILIFNNRIFQGPQAGNPVHIGMGTRGVAQEKNEVSPLP